MSFCICNLSGRRLENNSVSVKVSVRLVAVIPVSVILQGTSRVNFCICRSSCEFSVLFLYLHLFRMDFPDAFLYRWRGWLRNTLKPPKKRVMFEK